jgi:hypothetical protein
VINQQRLAATPTITARSAFTVYRPLSTVHKSRPTWSNTRSVRTGANHAAKQATGAKNCPNIQYTCLHCDQTGHVIANCPDMANVQCYRCKQIEHIAKTCPLLQRDSANEITSGSSSPSTVHDSKVFQGARTQVAHKAQDIARAALEVATEAPALTRKLHKGTVGSCNRKQRYSTASHRSNLR